MNVAVLTTLLRAIDNVTPVVDKMARGLRITMGGIRESIAGALGGVAIGAALVKFQQLTGQLTDLAAKTGATASGLHGLKLAFDGSGVSIDTVAAAISKMQTGLAGGEAGVVGALAQLGLRAGDIVRMQPDKAFTLVADAVGRIENPASKAKVAVDLFGKGGLALLPALNGEVAATAAKFERMGLVLSEDVIKAGDDWGDALGVLEAAGTAFLAQVLTPMLPAIVAVAETMGPLAAGVIPFLQRAFESLVLTGMKVMEWFYGFVASVLEMGAKVPLLGQAFGATADAAAIFRQRQVELKDAVAAYQVEVPKAVENTRKLPPPLEDVADRAKKAAEQAAFLERTLREARWDDARQRVEDLKDEFDKTQEELRQVVSEAGSAAEVITIGVLPATTSWQQALDQLKPSLTDTREGVRGLAAQLRGDLSSALKSMPQLLTQAFTGGGGMSGGLKAVGTQLGGSLGETLGGALASKVGGSLGKMLGSAGGPIGSILGGMAGAGLGKLAGKLFGGGEGRQVNDMRDQFVSAAGGIHELNVKAQAAGLSLDRLLNAKNVKDYEAAVRQLQGAFSDQEKDQELLRAAAEKYGLTLAELGPKFAQGQLDQQARGLLDEWRVLTAAGADMNAVASKMGPAVSQFVQETIKAGGQVPREMQGMVEKMIEMGTLTDAAGDKFTDLSQVPWKTDVTQALQDVAAKLDAVITKLAAGLSGAFDHAAKAGEEMASRVNRAIGGIHGDVTFDMQADGTNQGFRRGTLGRLGTWFGNFGRRTNADLHGVEAVITPAQAPAFARDVMAAGGGGAAPVTVHNDFRGAIVPDYAGALRLSDMLADSAAQRAVTTRRRTSVAGR